MKISTTIVKALVVAGIVSVMAQMTPLAQAALLTDAQKTTLNVSDLTQLVNAAKTIINGASAANKQTLAEEITAWVVANKSSLKAAFVLQLKQAYPTLAAAIQTKFDQLQTVTVVAGKAASVENADANSKKSP